MIPAAGQICELCCGAGGMAEGFSPFFDIVHAVDINPQVVQTYSANHQDTDVRQKDIRLLSGIRGDYDGITGVMQSGPATLETLTRATDEWTAMSGKFRNMIRLSWDRPAPAVVNLKKVYMVHPGENRNISLAEAASLQGFPAAYQWKGNESQIAQMIANAMPAQLAGAIAGSLA